MLCSPAVFFAKRYSIFRLLLCFNCSVIVISKSVARFSLLVMALSSVTPRVLSPWIIRWGIIFCAKSPTLGDIDLSNRP